MFLQPQQFFAKSNGFGRQVPMVFASVQVPPLDNAGRDSRARSGSRKQGLELLGLANDDLAGDCNHPSFSRHVGAQATPHPGIAITLTQQAWP